MIVVVFNSYPFLTGDKRKTLAEFKKEVMELINQALLKVGLKIFFAFLHTKEFKDIGVFDDVVISDLTLFLLRLERRRS